MSAWPERWAPTLSLRLPEPVDLEALGSDDEPSDSRTLLLVHLGDWTLPIVRGVGREPYHMQVAQRGLDLVWHTYTRAEAEALACDAAQVAEAAGYDVASVTPPSVGGG